MKAGVVGLGHVGLTTALCLSSVGHEVVGFDSDREKLSHLARGDAPFHEPGLPDLLRDGLASSRFRVAAHIGDVGAHSDVVLICVGTPIRDSGEANLTQVERVARAITSSIDHYTVLAEKSTVPVGTAEWIHRIASWTTPRAEYDVACNPEFLREGRAVEDTLNPSRIVVGAASPRAHDVMRTLYGPIVQRSGCPYIATDLQSAELIKLASNAFLATKISFINAVADICEAAGADVEVVAAAMGLDHRIGPQFLHAGLGYGGFCLPKDVAAFHYRAAELGVDVPLLSEIARINDRRTETVLSKIRRALWNVEGKRVAIWGLSFKPDTDDLREAPALRLVRRLVGEGASVIAHDPVAMEAAEALGIGIPLAEDPYMAAAGADAIVICTDWADYADLDLGLVREEMNDPAVIVDGRNLLDPQAVAAAGFIYASVGRPTVYPDRGAAAPPRLARTIIDRPPDP